MPHKDHDLREFVRKTYAEIAKGAEMECCEPACCTKEESGSSDFNMIGDAYKGIDGYVAGADLGLGCGLPVEHAGIVPGHTVLDLGSGAGVDAFIARRETGENGRVIGVDMTSEMIAKARANSEKLGYDNVEFRLGEIENLPVETGSVDVVISNCVLNLVPDKARAFGEIHRVLRSGGHFCISDTVVSKALPDWTTQIGELYAGCVAGAMPKADYLQLISNAGFTDVDVKAERRINIPEAVIRKFVDKKQISDAKIFDLYVLSITVTARKTNDDIHA